MISLRKRMPLVSSSSASADPPFITTTLTLYVEPSTALPGDVVTLYGWLDLPESEGDICPNIYVPLNDYVAVVPFPDNKIDICDVVCVTGRYGAKEGEELYDPRADFNKDGIIDILDVIFLAGRYGISTENKPIYIQKYEPATDSWVTIEELTTSSAMRSKYVNGKIVEWLCCGYFETQYTIPTDTPTPSVLYFRAYFPGGEYSH